MGQGAADFAKEIGFEAAETLTDVAAKEWIERVRANVPMERLPALLHRQEMLPWANLTRDPLRVHGTTNIIAIDSHGDLASAVSTSGWAWKYPGRLGDSPVIGAGNYCDNRYGAATCIGHGELAIRSSAARTAVMLMQMGSSPAEACRQVLNDLRVASGLVDGSFLTVLAVDAVGNVYSATNRTEPSEYYIMSPDMEAPQLRIGEYVAPGSGGE